jgi:alkanesulfonate monooxygenase
MAAARRLGATAVQYPKPVDECERERPADVGSLGIRIGIIARERADDAWAVAYARFPEDRRGQVAHGMAMNVSDSEWHRQLSRLGESPAGAEHPYWMTPFENYRTFCPYLVGSYSRVAEEVARYFGVGYRTLILDILPSADEMEHIGIVYREALALSGHLRPSGANPTPVVSQGLS